MILLRTYRDYEKFTILVLSLTSPSLVKYGEYVAVKEYGSVIVSSPKKVLTLYLLQTSTSVNVKI